jgi:dihydroflavonol-4-reductase
MNGEMRVLLTGGTGKIGNAVARRLAGRGDHVVALVRDPGRARGLLPAAVELAHGDVTDPESLRLAAAGADVAVNCMGIFEQWTRDPDVFNRVNAAGARAVARAAREAGAARMVHTSTFDVFHATRGGTVREDVVADYEKGTAYERSKQLAERLVRQEARGGSAGIEVVFVNPAGIIGPGPWAAGGFDPTLRDLLRGRLPLVPPGGMSLTYVDDAADAHVAALDRGRPGEHYIAAGGYASIREICAIAVGEAGRGRVPRTIPERLARRLADVGEAVANVIGKPPLLPAGQLEFLLWEARADSTKLREELGVEPRGAEEAVRRTVRWLMDERLV